MTALRGFLGFTNYYATYVQDYAKYAAPLMELLKVDRSEGKKGSKKAVRFVPQEKQAFLDIKRELQRGLELQTVNPDQPFVLRVDASDSCSCVQRRLGTLVGGLCLARWWLARRFYLGGA